MKVDAKTKKYFEWVRTLPCCICGGGDWNEQIGEWGNTVSHVKTKGSGGEHFNNVVPMCLKDHRTWEDSTKKTKPELLKIALIITDHYQSELLNVLQKHSR